MSIGRRPAASPEPPARPREAGAPGSGPESRGLGAGSTWGVDQTLRAELLAESPGLSQPGCGQLCALSQKGKEGGPGKAPGGEVCRLSKLERVVQGREGPGLERSAFKVTLNAHRAAQARMGKPRCSGHSTGLLKGGELLPSADPRDARTGAGWPGQVLSVPWVCRYSMEAQAMQRRCTCCQEARAHEEVVTMQCPDGTAIRHTYTHVDECSCTPACIPSPSAPKISRSVSES